MKAVLSTLPLSSRPRRPRDDCGLNEVVVRVRACGICGSDPHDCHDRGFGKVRVTLA